MNHCPDLPRSEVGIQGMELPWKEPAKSQANRMSRSPYFSVSFWVGLIRADCPHLVSETAGSCASFALLGFDIWHSWGGGELFLIFLAPAKRRPQMGPAWSRFLSCNQPQGLLNADLLFLGHLSTWSSRVGAGPGGAWLCRVMRQTKAHCRMLPYPTLGVLLMTSPCDIRTDEIYMTLTTWAILAWKIPIKFTFVGKAWFQKLYPFLVQKHFKIMLHHYIWIPYAWSPSVL